MSAVKNGQGGLASVFWERDAAKMDNFVPKSRGKAPFETRNTRRTVTSVRRHQDRAGWRSGKALHLHSEGIRFECRSEPRLP
jgi:hypothetical protein